MKHRLKSLRALLQQRKIDAVFVSHPATIAYLTKFSFLAPTEREAFLFITKKTHIIISSNLYKDEIQEVVPHFTFIDFISPEKKTFWEKVEEIIAKEKIQTIGFEGHNLTVAEHNQLLKHHTNLKHISLDEIREKKDSNELLAIKKACNITDKTFSYVLQHIRKGMSEKDVAFLIDVHIRKAGAEPSFGTIVAFGKNAAVPHHITGNTTLKKPNLILLDFGVKIDNYCSDMTRTIFFGQPTAKQKKVYTAVKNAQQKALAYLVTTKQPISAEKADAIARKFIAQKGFPVFSHTLGHSIGIDVHDGFRLSPKSPTQLVNGMVFSVEPGIYLPKEFGVRIEDTVALVKNKLEILTTSTKDIIVL